MPVRAARSATDGAIAALAAEHAGVVARRDLIRAGASRHAISSRIASGLLIPLWPGVYGVGNPNPGMYGWMWAALLAAGPGSWLALESAAWKLGWLGARSEWQVGRTGRGARLDGLRIHGLRPLPANELGRVDGVPCASPARTLVDLAARRPARVVERCLDQWDRQGSYDGAALEAAMRPGRPGAASLRRLLARHAVGSTATRSEFEERCVRFLRARGITGWVFNEPMTLPSGVAIVVDVWFARERVAIELDGRDTHARAAAFESDRARDLELLELGIAPGRVSWRKLTREPGWVEARLRGLLARRTVVDRAG